MLNNKEWWKLALYIVYMLSELHWWESGRDYSVGGAIQWVDTLPWLQSSLDVGIKTMGPQRYPKHRFLCKSLWEINPQHSTQRHAVCTSPTACTPAYGVWKVRGASFQVPEIRSHNFGRGNSQWLSIELGATWCNCDLKDFEPNGKDGNSPLHSCLPAEAPALLGTLTSSRLCAKTSAPNLAMKVQCSNARTRHTFATHLLFLQSFQWISSPVWYHTVPTVPRCTQHSQISQGRVLCPSTMQCLARSSSHPTKPQPLCHAASNRPSRCT